MILPWTTPPKPGRTAHPGGAAGKAVLNYAALVALRVGERRHRCVLYEAKGSVTVVSGDAPGPLSRPGDDPALVEAGTFGTAGYP